MKQYSTNDIVDAVVIGTGAGGAPLLARLALAGLKVVAIEAGKWWDPADFATDEKAQGGIYWQGERISGGGTPTAFGGNNSGTGVGGSTLHWGAFVPRADARDLRIRTEFGVGADWPLTAEELLPYYVQVEGFLGVSGPEDYPWDPARRYPLPPVALNAPAQAMEKGFRALGLRTAEAPVAVVSRDYSQPGYPLRHACVNRGYCHQGCRNGAKASMDVTYLPVAIGAGAEIRAESFVLDIERDAAGLVTAVVYRHDGQDVRQRCRAVFLCGGAVETPRLLLNRGLANGSGLVGRNFMAHVATQVWGTFAESMRMNKGFPASLISEDLMRAPDADYPGGYIVQSLGVVPVTFASQVARGRKLWGKALVDYLDQYNYLGGIGMNGDCLPDERNALTLSNEVDGFGVPKVLVRFSYGEAEKAMSAHGEKVMTEAWKAAGATDVWTFQRSAHVIGTCRMAGNERDGVVDSFGRSFEIPNLWICDNSVFPSSLAANPALTIMALSLRTADRFLSTPTLGEKS
ncbi:GMC family oxidoreductase [Granulicella sibirica]|nr:GMC family oxidoreductase [Granulicella sibirica]